MLNTCVYSTTVLQPRPSSSSFVWTPHSLWTISNHPPSLPLGELLWICRKTFISCLHLVEKPEKPQLGKANEYKIDKVKGGKCEIRFSRIFFSIFKSEKHRHTMHFCRSQNQKLKDSSEYESCWATLRQNADACHLHRWLFYLEENTHVWMFSDVPLFNSSLSIDTVEITKQSAFIILIYWN